MTRFATVAALLLAALSTSTASAQLVVQGNSVLINQKAAPASACVVGQVCFWASSGTNHITIRAVDGTDYDLQAAFVGATSGSNGTQGAVPLPTAGQQTFALLGNGTWTNIGGAGPFLPLAGGTMTGDITLKVNATLANSAAGAAGTTGIELEPNVASGSSTALDINSLTTLSSGDTLFQTRNNGTVRFFIDGAGNVTTGSNSGGVFTSLTVGGPNSSGSVFTQVLDRAPSAGGTLNIATSSATQISIGGSQITSAVNAIGIGSGKGTVALTWTNAPATAHNLVTMTMPSDTSQTASTEISSFNFVAATRQWTSGAITTEREWIIHAPTYSFAGGGSTIATAATFDITNAPQAGTGATITNAYALNVEAGASLFGGTVNITAPAVTSGAQSYLVVTGAASTGQTASTEINFANFALNQTITWATGAIATERVIRVRPTTLAFVGASTVALAAMDAVDGPPIAGSNATITESVDTLLTYNGVGSVSTVGGSIALSIQNTTAAANGSQQFSPQIEQCGAGWGTTGSASQTVCSAIQFQPVQGATPTGKWSLNEAINGAAYVSKWQFTDGGALTYEGTLSALSFGNEIVYTGTSAVANHAFKSSSAVSTAGNFIAEFYDSTSGAGEVFVGLASGVVHTFAETGTFLTCNGTCTANEAACYNGNNTVANCATTANLTTIAGVFVSSGTVGTVKVATHGSTMTSCDAGVAAGNLVGTSGATGGNVAAGSPGAGAIVGRAEEATSTTTAGQCKVFLILG